MQICTVKSLKQLQVEQAGFNMEISRLMCVSVASAYFNTWTGSVPAKSVGKLTVVKAVYNLSFSNISKHCSKQTKQNQYILLYYLGCAT